MSEVNSWIKKVIETEIDDHITDYTEDYPEDDDEALMDEIAVTIERIIDDEMPSGNGELAAAVTRDLVHDYVMYMFKEWYSGELKSEEYIKGINERIF